MSPTSSYAPVVTRWCSSCAAETGFEQPECLDGHGPDGRDCPEKGGEGGSGGESAAPSTGSPETAL